MLRNALVKTSDNLVAEDSKFAQRDKFLKDKIEQLNKEIEELDGTLPEHEKVDGGFAVQGEIDNTALENALEGFPDYLDTALENLQLKDAIADLESYVGKLKDPKTAIARFNELVEAGELEGNIEGEEGEEEIEMGGEEEMIS